MIPVCLMSVLEPDLVTGWAGAVSSRDSGDTAPGVFHRSAGVKLGQGKGKGGEDRRRVQGSKGENRGGQGKGEDSKEEERWKGRKRRDRKGCDGQRGWEDWENRQGKGGE